MTSHIKRLGNESRYVGLINSQTYGKVSHEIPEGDKDIHRAQPSRTGPQVAVITLQGNSKGQAGQAGRCDKWDFYPSLVWNVPKAESGSRS